MYHYYPTVHFMSNKIFLKKNEFYFSAFNCNFHSYILIKDHTFSVFTVPHKLRSWLWLHVYTIGMSEAGKYSFGGFLA